MSEQGISVNLSVLDQVIEKTISTVEESKTQIFEITEQAQTECQRLRRELEKVKQEVAATIEKSDQLEHKFRLARQHLAKMSQRFEQYSEEEVRLGYERASRIQVDLYITLEKEKQLRKQRDELGIRLKQLDNTVGKAEDLMSKVSVVFDYLTGEIQQAHQVLEDVEHRQQWGLQIIQSQEEERRRMARDIHDGPAQCIANANLRIELVERMLDQGKVDKARREIKDLKELIHNSLGDVRRIIFDLRPMVLDDLGLVPALKKYIEGLAERHPITFDLKTFGRQIRLSPVLEVALFRLVQESLTNVIKHAQAQHAQIKLEYQRDRIFLLIKDDGVGFDSDETQGFGLMGMKERMKLLEGETVIRSTPKHGTKILLKIPIKTDDQ